MWSVTVRDLWFRKRQFALAVFGAALVFSVALSLTGMNAGFVAEAHSTVTALGGDRWIVPAGVGGPFTSVSLLDAGVASQLSTDPSREAGAVMTVQSTVLVDGKPKMAVLIGYQPGTLPGPRVRKGRALLGPGEAVPDARLGVGSRSKLMVGALPLSVVGEVSGKSALGGMPVVFMDLADVQLAGFGGRPVATAIVSKGVPTAVPAGLRVMTNAQVQSDLLRPLKSAQKTIGNTRLLMWLVAGVIIGMVIYLAALDRVRDFAVLKAVGAPGGSLAASMCLEALLASVLAALLAAVLSRLLRGIYTLPVAITPVAYLVLPAVAVVVGLLASLAALRRTMRVDPALAFGG